MTERTFTPGLGTVSFVKGSSEAFGQLRVGDDLVSAKGVYTGERIALECDDASLVLTPIARPAVNGPRARGTLTFFKSGARLKVSMFAPKNGRAYGLSLDERASTETHLPF
jgi:hypothetical protein